MRSEFFKPFYPVLISAALLIAGPHSACSQNGGNVNLKHGHHYVGDFDQEIPDFNGRSLNRDDRGKGQEPFFVEGQKFEKDVANAKELGSKACSRKPTGADAAELDLYPIGPENPDGGSTMLKRWTEWRDNVYWAIQKKVKYAKWAPSGYPLSFVFEITVSKDRHVENLKVSHLTGNDLAESKILHLIESMDGDKVFEFPSGTCATKMYFMHDCRLGIGDPFFGNFFDTVRKDPVQHYP